MHAEPLSNKNTGKSRLPIQTNLKIGRPGDKYEQEADRVADYVMRSSSVEPIQMQTQEEEEELQMKCENCEEDELQMKPQLQFKNGTSFEASPDVSSKIGSSKGTGSALTPALQREMSTKIGADFSGVNIHTGSDAIQMNRELGARAFTQGNDIYFNSGEYKPSSSEGKHLLAHELTHVVQQGNNGALSSVQRQLPSSESDNQSNETLDRDWVYHRIGLRLSSAFTTFATACERHRNQLRSAAADQVDTAGLILDVILTMVSPGLGGLLRRAVSNAVATEASLIVYRIALGAIDRSDQIISAAGSVAKQAAKQGFQAVLSSSQDEHYVDELYQAMRVGLDDLHGSLPQKSDEELSVIYANYDPEIATLNHYVSEIGRLISLYQSQIAPIGQRTGGAYGPMKARWIEGSNWRALALTGEGRYYNSDRRPHLISWISTDMRSLAINATQSASQIGVEHVHYQDLNLTGIDAERALAMLDSEYSYLGQCGMVVERSSGVSPRRGAACPGCHGDGPSPEMPQPNFDYYDRGAWDLFREGEQNLTERDQLLEWIRQVEQD
jgi:hypothetical protein